MDFWMGWAVGVLCGILLVFGGVWIALQVQTARAMSRSTFKSLVVNAEPNLIQKALLWVFVVIWAVIEALSQVGGKK